MTYKDWIIPPGVRPLHSLLIRFCVLPFQPIFANGINKTPVGMTSLLMHHNEEIFPDSQSFIPERWMDPEQRKHLEKYLVAFSKGSRQCIGIPYVKLQ
jgi:hypothetical protein